MQAGLTAPATVIPHLARLALVGLLVLTPIWGRDHAARLPWLYLVVLALAVALFAAPLVRALALWCGVLDMPAARKVHDVATPLLGGAAVYCAFAVTVLINFDFSLQLKGVAVGATLVVGQFNLQQITKTSFAFTKNGVFAKSIFGFGDSKCRPGGSFLFCNASTALMSPVTPAAVSR